MIGASTDAGTGSDGVVTLLGVPYDASSSALRGTAGAPAHIRRAFADPATNTWAESLIDIGAPGVLADAGDVDLGDADTVRERIDTAVSTLVGAGRRPIVLGGDHSITFPVVRAVRRHYPRLALLHFDAHPDLYDEFEGDRHSHACPFARIMEAGAVDRLVQVGIRTMNAHQRAQADRFGVEIVFMRDWTDTFTPVFRDPVYVSIDLDALDPAYAPGVSHREPGGLSVRQLLGVLQRMQGTIVGADLVEFNPLNDPVGLTGPVCAKIVKELAARMLAPAAADSPEGPAGRKSARE